MTSPQPNAALDVQTTSMSSEHSADQPKSEPAAECSLELLEKLRAGLAEHDAAAAQRHAELAAELARQEEIWAAKEAERLRQEQLEIAYTDYQTLCASYGQLVASAETAYEELHRTGCHAAVVFKKAIQAEIAKREATPALESAWQRLRDLKEEVDRPTLAADRSFVFGPHDPRDGVSQIGLSVYPSMRRALARLASGESDAGGMTPDAGQTSKMTLEMPVEPAHGAPDHLDIIFATAQAKRRQDDHTPRATELAKLTHDR